MLKGLTPRKCVLYTESYTKLEVSAEKVNHLNNAFNILNRIKKLKRVLKGLSPRKCVLYTESYSKLEMSAETVNRKKCVLYTELYTKC